MDKIRIRRYRGYAIAEDGRVFKNGKEAKGYVDNDYLRFGYEEKRFYLHRVMIPLFTGKDVTGLDVHHIDGNKLNNSLSNLVALTKSEHRSIHNANMSEETKRKISNTQKGRVISEEERRKISLALKGRKKSEEHRAKIAERNRMRNNKKVIATIGKFSCAFNSIKEGKEKLGASGVSQVLRGRAKHAGKVKTPTGEIKIAWRYADE